MSDDAVTEFKTIVEEEFGEALTLDQAREMARRFLTFCEALALFIARQEHTVTPLDDDRLVDESASSVP